MVRSRRRNLLWWGIGLTGVVLLAAVALYHVSNARCFSLVGEAICRVDVSEPLVALTFDDGPTAEGVEWASSALRRADARATFFLIGNEVEGREPLVRRLVAEGHEIGNHSFSHKRMLLHRESFYGQEIDRTEAALRRAGIPSTRLFRPPYGKKLVGLPRALARRGYRLIMWDVEDPAGASTPRDYADRMLSRVRPGSIILMHIMYRGNRRAREALPLVLEGLRTRGYRIVTVGELLTRDR